MEKEKILTNTQVDLAHAAGALVFIKQQMQEQEHNILFEEFPIFGNVYKAQRQFLSQNPAFLLYNWANMRKVPDFIADELEEFEQALQVGSIGDQEDEAIDVMVGLGMIIGFQAERIDESDMAFIRGVLDYVYQAADIRQLDLGSSIDRVIWEKNTKNYPWEFTAIRPEDLVGDVVMKFENIKTFLRAWRQTLPNRKLPAANLEYADGHKPIIINEDYVLFDPNLELTAILQEPDYSLYPEEWQGMMRILYEGTKHE